MELSGPGETGNGARVPLAVLGAGPAGLGAAWRLARRRGFDVTVIEKAGTVGGNAASFELDGLKVDYGSHRLHPSCAPEILTDIRTMLGDGLLDRPRHGRIRLRGRWVHFPLKPADLVMHLPPGFVAGVFGDSLRKLTGAASEDTFAAVLERGLGRTICRDFYFPYARKIWGVDPVHLDPEQARRRVSAGSLFKMVRKVLNAVPGFKKPGSGRFYYPRAGFGAISDAYAAAAATAGARLNLRTGVTAVELENGRVRAIQASSEQGMRRIEARQVLSTIPISLLARLIQPAAPEAVLASACSLRFRAMILIYMTLDTDRFTEYDAHYFPDAEIGITRLSEPKNYGLADLPGRTILCAELPCSTEDAVWRATDSELGVVLAQALKAAGLPVACKVRAVASRRLAQAYPIYTRDYREHFDRIDAWLNGIDGLVTFGRQGLFAHDNTHHALAMAYALEGCLDDSGNLDRRRWEECRRAFQAHVVED
jgi:protoporphyrinogen oxidase